MKALSTMAICSAEGLGVPPWHQVVPCSLLRQTWPTTFPQIFMLVVATTTVGLKIIFLEPSSVVNPGVVRFYLNDLLLVVKRLANMSH